MSVEFHILTVLLWSSSFIALVSLGAQFNPTIPLKLASGDGPDASDENIKYVRFSGTKGGLSTLPS